MANVRKRGNSYQIRVSAGYDSEYRQVIHTKTWKPTPGMTERQIEKEVARQAIMFEEYCKKGIVTVNVKFKEFAEKWLNDFARVNLKKTTFQRMKNTTIRVYAAFGHLRVDSITRGQIQAFVDDMAKNGKNMKTGKPLSRKSIVHHLNFLSDVFNYALRFDMIDSNPCNHIFVPKGEKKEKEIYTVEEMKQLFKLVNQYAPLKYKAFLTLAVYSGFRNGELMGLEWKDVDWENNVISVRRTSNYTVTDGNYTDTPKTKSSIRSLKLPQQVFDVLSELRESQLKNKENLGTKWIDSDRLFVTEIVKPLHRGSPYKWQREFTERHGMRFCDIHSLRHFNATVLINAGVDTATVSSALGHSNISTTTNIYFHAIREAQARTGEVIAAVLDFSDKKSEAG